MASNLKTAVNLLFLANNAKAALSLVLLVTAFAIWFLSSGQGFESFFSTLASGVAVLGLFLIVGLSIKIINYLLLVLMLEQISSRPKFRFQANSNIEKTKAKVVRMFVEKKVDYTSADFFSKGEQMILSQLREFLNSKAPSVLVARNPFILIKLEPLAQADLKGKALDKTLVSIIEDCQDAASSTFEKQLESELKK